MNHWVIGTVAWDCHVGIWRKQEDREEIDFVVERRALGCAGFVYRLLRHFVPCRLIGPRDMQHPGCLPVLPMYTSFIHITDMGPTFGVYSTPYGDVEEEVSKLSIRKSDGVILHDPTGYLTEPVTRALAGKKLSVFICDSEVLPKRTERGWYFKRSEVGENCLVGRGRGVELNGEFVENFFEGDNTVGCGDALVVGFYLGKARGWSDLDALKLGVLFANCEANLGPWAEEFNEETLVRMCIGKIGGVPEILMRFLGGVDNGTVHDLPQFEKTGA